GMGYLSRKFGLASDNILDAQIVLANGTIVYNAKNYPELLWAIRGAGNAGFGIVTTLTLRIYPIPKIVTNLRYEYDFDQTPLVFSVIKQLGNNIHQNLTLYMNIRSVPSTSISGIYLGSASELRLHMQEFVKLSKPKSVTYGENDLYSILVGGGDTPPPGFMKAKTFFFDSRGLSYEGIKYLMRFVKKISKCKLQSETLLISGGRVNEIRRNDTAYVHRGFLYHTGMFLHDYEYKNFDMCYQEMEKFSQYFQPHYANYENYQNLIDRQLNNWQCRYYGENFERLVEIKRKYDPYNI
ncbi:14071_t:CDS:1, partial [Dentiscutata heterogama]